MNNPVQLIRLAALLSALLLGAGAAAQGLPEKLPIRSMLNANHCDGDLEMEACYGYLEYQLGDYREAVRIWRELAKQGDVVAQRNLGLMYQRGRGVLRDLRKAADWYQRAADQGDPGAEFALGAMYQEGKGVFQDLSQAVLLYRRAVRDGSSRAAYRLGLMYRFGVGVGTDSRQEFRYLRISAFRGFAPAQVEMGKFFFRRHRDDGDKIRACAFFRFAINSADDSTVSRAAGDWLFRVQDDITGDGMHSCREIARGWVADLRASGGSADF